MKMLIAGIVIFLIIVYVFAYRQHKKKRKQTIDTVQDFNRKYAKTFLNGKTDGNQNVTDYVDKQSLYEEVQHEIHPEIQEKPVKRKTLEF